MFEPSRDVAQQCLCCPAGRVRALSRTCGLPTRSACTASARFCAAAATLRYATLRYATLRRAEPSRAFASAALHAQPSLPESPSEPTTCGAAWKRVAATTNKKRTGL